jgi:acetolactate synthase-1/2/3 large subunit
VIESLHRATNGNAFVTSDVGQHQMFAAQYYRFDEPRRWINSGGLGTMGFGLPGSDGREAGASRMPTWPASPARAVSR